MSFLAMKLFKLSQFVDIVSWCLIMSKEKEAKKSSQEEFE